jgi:RNA polymerase sigma factor (sigma-70 family)
MRHESNMNLLSDVHLLKAYKETGDEAAFGELMSRHSRMVLGAARNVLRNASSAEDISQATFLTLARKADALGDTVSLGGWLYHVAVCLARDELRKVQRRVAREEEAAMLAEQSDAVPTFSEAAIAALHEELGNLSETHRAPIVLHHLECRSYEDAAAALGCSMNSFGPTLTRAREKLRKRLAGRGIALGAGALVAILGQSASAAELPAGFVASTCAAAKGGVVSAKVAALTESALKMLFWAKVQTVAAICAVAVSLAGAGVGVAVTVPLVLKQEAATATKMAQEDAQPEASVQGGRVWAWGNNFFGQLGDGTKNSRAYPSLVPGLDGVIAVSVGGQHTVALKSDGTVWTWGGNSVGQLGDGTTTKMLYPAAVAGLAEVRTIAAGYWHTLALKADGGVWTWGNNHVGQLGNGTTNNSPLPVPVTLPDGTPLTGAIALAAGDAHSVAIRSDGSVWTWGDNQVGELGDGTTITRLNPVPVRLADGLLLSGINAIAAGSGYTVALKSDGTLWSWGLNQNGYLGDGTMINRPNPTPVKTAVDAPFVAIAASSHHTVALKADSTVWAWGSNVSGALGDGTRVNAITTPTPVRMTDGSALSNVTAVAAGKSCTLALKTDGTLVAWGKTDGGPVLHPMQVKLADGTSLSNITAIAAGRSGSVAIVEE